MPKKKKLEGEEEELKPIELPEDDDKMLPAEDDDLGLSDDDMEDEDDELDEETDEF